MEDVDRHKPLLDRVVRTSEPLMKLTARSQIPALQAEVRQVGNRYLELCKSARVRLNRVETSLKQSDEVSHPRLFVFRTFCSLYIRQWT